jgi:hypothetical protein
LCGRNFANPESTQRKWRADLDVVPKHYVAGWQPPATENIHNLMWHIPLIDQRLIHASWDRVRGGDKLIYLGLIDWVFQGFDAFVTHLRNASSPWTDNFVDALNAGREAHRSGVLPSDF